VGIEVLDRVIDGSDPKTATIASSYLQTIIQTFSGRIILAQVQREGVGGSTQGLIDLRARVWYNEDLRSVNFSVPGLIAEILMMSSAQLTSGAIACERGRGTRESLVAPAIRSHELMLGRILACTMLALIAVVLVALAGTLWFGVPLRGSIPLLFFCSLLFLMSSLGIGLLLSAAMPSQQAAMNAAMMFTMVPGIMLSGFFFPIESMPVVIQPVTYLIPARYYVVILRGIFLKGARLAELWDQVIPLTVHALLTLTAAVHRFRKLLR
jgi:ABC-2 type transport system permease protein